VLGVVAVAASALLVASPPPEVGGEAASTAGGGANHGGRARNVIFIQGDGMGIAHRELIRLATKGQDGDLRMNRMDTTGLVHTDSADPEEAVTDSAAAATAYATGVRSYNGAIGVDVNGRSVKNLLEYAKEAGKATGLVTTSQVTDA
jgi:alkaline phosphatase